MTEQEWLAVTYPESMVRLLREKPARKLRLLFCASSRSVLSLADRPMLRKAVEVGERYAGGLASPSEVDAVRRELWPDPGVMGDRLSRTAFGAVGELFPVWAITAAVDLLLTEAVKQARERGRRSLPKDTRKVIEGSVVGLIGCVFGNPFRPVATDPSWLTSTVVTLATDIYSDRAFDRLPNLADALQDAGCDNSDVLDHCRGPGPHVRGCHVLDLILGKG
ncbi:MAG: hypothetical protein JWO38_1124 [Gemmataceae bacterium]|nr:hypothetical protein [Gemmataceae bacterium]